jgi:hypothetical protein
VWMTLFYPWPAHDGLAVYVIRLIVGSAMTMTIVRGVTAIFRRDYVAHGDWMTRGYALAMGAGTQVVTHLPWTLTVGMPGEVGRAFAMGSAWVINIAVAEYAIRRSRSRATSPSSTPRRPSLSDSPGTPQRAPWRGPEPRTDLARQ